MNTTKTEAMSVHNIINLRALMHDALTKQAENVYGRNSATMKGKYFYTNLGIHVSIVLKPVIQDVYPTVSQSTLDEIIKYSRL
jgi:hypothetical protein